MQSGDERLRSEWIRANAWMPPPARKPPRRAAVTTATIPAASAPALSRAAAPRRAIHPPFAVGGFAGLAVGAVALATFFLHVDTSTPSRASEPAQIAAQTATIVPATPPPVVGTAATVAPIPTPVVLARVESTPIPAPTPKPTATPKPKPKADAKALVAAGMKILDEGNGGAAAAKFKAALAADPKESHAWLGLGTAYILEGRNADAKKALSRFLALAPSDPMAGQTRQLLQSL